MAYSWFVLEQVGKPGRCAGVLLQQHCLAKGTPGKVARPAAAFGLELGFTKVTDAGLTALAGLKDLVCR